MRPRDSLAIFHLTLWNYSNIFFSCRLGEDGMMKMVLISHIRHPIKCIYGTDLCYFGSDCKTLITCIYFMRHRIFFSHSFIHSF